MSERPAFEGWAILELMGHRRLGGYVQEATVAGTGFLRIDVPGEQGPMATQLYSPSLVYCLTPTNEDMARAVAKRNQPEPVQRWELPQASPVQGPTEACLTCGVNLVEGEENVCANCEPFK